MDYQDLFFEVLMSTYNQKKNVMELTLSPEAYELLKDLCKDAAEKEVKKICGECGLDFVPFNPFDESKENADSTPINFGAMEVEV